MDESAAVDDSAAVRESAAVDESGAVEEESNEAMELSAAEEDETLLDQSAALSLELWPGWKYMPDAPGAPWEAA